jgi:hypothetical protein
MAEQKLPSEKLILGSTKGKLVRMSYLHAHTPRMNNQSNKMECSTAVLIPKTNVEDVAAVQALIAKLTKAAFFDEKTKKIVKGPQFWSPMRDGDVDTKQDGSPYGAECKGHYIINAKSSEDAKGNVTLPKVVGTTKMADGKLKPLLESEIKSGDWGRVGINFKPYTKGTGGIGTYLSTIQLVLEGESLGSSASAEDDFGQFEDQEDDGLML